MAVPAPHDRERRAIAAALHGFAPIADARARLLILGSMPGMASLHADEYYAHPRNGFWPIMESVWSIPATASYAARTRAVKRAGIAIWDVLASCRRSSSLDSDIDAGSMVVNDFTGFLQTHASIHAIAFNGGTAARLFHRHVLPGLGIAWRQIPMLRLPSTSPAHARLSLADKRRAWAALAIHLA
jgi:double-stranded uracil-DNA glycosylase